MNEHTNGEHFREAGTCSSWGLHAASETRMFHSLIWDGRKKFSNNPESIRKVNSAGELWWSDNNNGPSSFSASWYPHSLVVSSTLTLGLARWPSLTNGTSKHNAKTWKGLVHWGLPACHPWNPAGMWTCPGETAGQWHSAPSHITALVNDVKLNHHHTYDGSYLDQLAPSLPIKWP